MNVCELPFNKFIGLQISTNPQYLMMLDKNQHYQNHLETVHASAQFALAEATSGKFLIDEFQELTDIVPVVRKVETKYKKPAIGELYSKANFVEITKEQIIDEINSRGRILLTVRVNLFDTVGKNVMQSDFEWFIVKN